ncbi:ribose transport system ATP-binding protein [Alkalibacter saccharofermentans DSM 14828]|uniref:Ribose transport system ATP-binding protein n=2 Tax=Alkalibacter TaxID=274470 RepID=A0A1M4W3U0_9FIRM|nr:ribose transport system ATP-binding protein [Alkalibacter saccharofermentans DSM 14828]
MNNSKLDKGTAPHLEIKDLCKQFGITTALNKVSFSVGKGIVCGLVGENGSGKSTLASIVAGMQSSTSGEVYLKGKRWQPKSVLEAQRLGVAMIVQEMGTIGNVTVAENIFLGQENVFAKGLFIERKKLFTEAQKLLDSLGIDSFDARTYVGKLDMQDRKLVEIAKAMYWKPDIFIVDETTTALSHTGRTLLYRLIRELSQNGGTVLFISHDLEEMMEHCDQLIVLRDGVYVGALEKKDYDGNIIKKMMVGRELYGDYYHADLDGYSDEVVLRADFITTLHDLLGFSIELHKGEVLGIGGLSNCGMHTLGKALFGAEKILDGKVYTGNGTAIKSTKDAIENKIGYMSKNRDQESLGLNATVKENIASVGYKLNRVFGPIISYRKESDYVNKQIKDLSIKCASPDHLTNTLSGGNKQKIVFGKWIAADSEILIMDCPTRGVDIGVKAAMYKLIYEMKKAGKSIILISEELQELIGMSDRVIIIRNGEIASETLRSEGLNEHKLIESMV